MASILEWAAIAGAVSVLFATIVKVFGIVRKLENAQQAVDKRQDEKIAYLSGRLDTLAAANSKLTELVLEKESS
ncbi:hypothetical protein Xen7305DRAFT_00008860 [Xenococcus sp. PCC 7305]|uniref:hypothetical protein n=1 Tax=Xenococcus sp. PCC 7305 TaxID=102125 RepID=UPI0002ACAA5B|nr:hypothetical protein [Xenococcus sp. PCC 7305]ELS01184.1 hypothetical protein Xen7305DRAFT_00008860 [Xenococcus sp. PCC 7305]